MFSKRVSTHFGSQYGNGRHFMEPTMGEKAGICWHFETVQNPTRLAVSTNTSFFAVFQANLLNENEILAIIIRKLQNIILSYEI